MCGESALPCVYRFGYSIRSSLVFSEPTILIPEPLDLPSDDPEPLRLSFLHELAHIARSDHWFGTVASLAQTVWFLLPHTWWLRSQLLIDQEFLADCSAASRYGTSSGYASSLLSMASRPGQLPAEVAGGPAAALGRHRGRSACRPHCSSAC